MSMPADTPDEVKYGPSSTQRAETPGHENNVQRRRVRKAAVRRRWPAPGAMGTLRSAVPGAAHNVR
jgi:hypothetical protein